MSKEKHQIAVKARETFGKNAARRSRKAGIVPAVVYSKKSGARAIELSADEWAVLSGHHVQMLTLVEDGRETLALVKEVQYNHLKNYFVHIDFLEVDPDADIVSMVPIHAHGDCIGAAHGGVLEQELHEIEVICHPDKLPDFIAADVSNLEVGNTLHVSDLALPDGVRTKMDGEHTVFSVTVPHEETAAAAEEGAAEPEAIKEKKDKAPEAEAKSGK